MRITLLTPIMQGEGDGQSPTFFKADRSSYNLQGWRWAPAVRVQDREGRGAPGGSCPAGPGSRGRWLGQGPSPKAQPVGMMVGGYPSRLLGPSAPPPLREIAKPTRKLELLKPGHHNHQRARLVARSFRWVGTSGQSPGRAPGFLPCEPDLGLELREGGGKDRSWAGSLASPSPLSFSALFLSILRVPPTSFVLLFHPLRMHIEDITLPPCAPVSHASSLSAPHLSPDPSGLGPTASALRDEIGEAH